MEEEGGLEVPHRGDPGGRRGTSAQFLPIPHPRSLFSVKSPGTPSLHCRSRSVLGPGDLPCPARAGLGRSAAWSRGGAGRRHCGSDGREPPPLRSGAGSLGIRGRGRAGEAAAEGGRGWEPGRRSLGFVSSAAATLPPPAPQPPASLRKDASAQGCEEGTRVTAEPRLPPVL